MTATDTAVIRSQMEALDGHTPGPLHIRTLENFGWNIVHYQGGSLHDFLRVAKATLEQDARLIAAAPDMRATIPTLCDEVDRLRAENERLRSAFAEPIKAMELFFEADEAADDARRIGSDDDVARYEKMATARWQCIPDMVERARAALAQKEEE